MPHISPLSWKTSILMFPLCAILLSCPLWWAQPNLSNPPLIMTSKHKTLTTLPPHPW